MGIRPVAVIGLILIASPAQATPIEDAKVSFFAGKEAFERGDYEAALQNFLRANQLVPAPSLQYNIGNCHERLGHYREAATAFERYLELSGPPSTDDEKDFQEKLRARLSANKERAEQAQPPPPPVYQQPLYQPPPMDYIPTALPPGPWVNPATREYLLKTARARRARAIALMATGLALHVIGMGLLIDGLVTPRYDFERGSCCRLDTAPNIAEDFFGVSFMVVGITLWAPGAASFVGAEKQLHELTRPEPAAPGPKAFLFHSPVFRF